MKLHHFTALLLTLVLSKPAFSNDTCRSIDYESQFETLAGENPYQALMKFIEQSASPTESGPLRDKDGAWDFIMIAMASVRLTPEQREQLVKLIPETRLVTRETDPRAPPQGYQVQNSNQIPLKLLLMDPPTWMMYLDRILDYNFLTHRSFSAVIQMTPAIEAMPMTLKRAIHKRIAENYSQSKETYFGEGFGGPKVIEAKRLYDIILKTTLNPANAFASSSDAMATYRTYIENVHRIFSQHPNSRLKTEDIFTVIKIIDRTLREREGNQDFAIDLYGSFPNGRANPKDFDLDLGYERGNISAETLKALERNIHAFISRHYGENTKPKVMDPELCGLTEFGRGAMHPIVIRFTNDGPSIRVFRNGMPNRKAAESNDMDIEPVDYPFSS